MGVESDEPGLRFGRWRLLPLRRRLLADGGPVPLGARAFDLLLALVEARGALVTKDDLLRRVWPGTTVEENNLQVQVSALRKALGGDAPGLIATIPGRGYRFTGAVQATPASGTTGSVASPAAPSPTPPAPLPSGRPMLVVLPFADMTGDPEQAYFADGITEDLTTALSHMRWFSVIARGSAFTYKGRAVDVRQVGRELGVGYVLEGSVRKAGGRLRITAQLCEAEAGRHVWAERFDGDLADVFDLQDRVTEAVAGAIEPSLRLAEAERIRARPTESLGAYDLYLRALPHRSSTREGNDEALRLLRRAVALDTGFVAAKGALAGQIVVRFAQGWASDADVQEALRLAREVLAEGGGEEPTALGYAGRALTYLGHFHEAGLAATDRALRLAPGSAHVLMAAAWNRIYVDDWRTAIGQIERAVRLSPVDPSMSHFVATLGAAHFVGEAYEASIECQRRAAHDRPGFLVALRFLAASLALLGRRGEAHDVVGSVLAAVPGYTLAAASAHSAFRGPTRDRYLGGLRRAGLPD